MKGIVMLNRQERDVSKQGTRQVPVEKRIKLAQYIRAENMDNRMKIRQREKILYGTDTMPPLWNKGDSLRAEGYFGPDENTGAGMENTSNTFKFRMAMAIVLFIGFLLCDAGQYKVFGYSMNDIYGMLSEDYFNLYDSQNAEAMPQLTELLK